MWKALGAAAVALFALMFVAMNRAPAISALAGTLLVILASVAAVLSGAPVGKRGAYVGRGLLFGLGFLGMVGVVHVFGEVWGPLIAVALGLTAASLGEPDGERPREYVPRYVKRGALIALVLLGGVVLVYVFGAVWWTFAQ
jgi:hypothetical protein